MQANTGVLFVRRTKAALALLDYWVQALDFRETRQAWDPAARAGLDAGVAGPCDQRVFNALVLPRFRDHVAVVPFRAVNTPVGEYVAHLWGGVNRLRYPFFCLWRKVVGLTDARLARVLAALRDAGGRATVPADHAWDSDEGEGEGGAEWTGVARHAGIAFPGDRAAEEAAMFGTLNPVVAPRGAAHFSFSVFGDLRRLGAQLAWAPADDDSGGTLHFPDRGVWAAFRDRWPGETCGRGGQNPIPFDLIDG